MPGHCRIAILAAACLVWGCSSGEKPKEKQAPLVSAALPQPHLFADVVQAVGTARANEQVTIASSVTERIERVLFDDGMAVGRGQLLAVLSQGTENASLRGAVAAEKQATAQLSRIQNLFDRGFATRVQLDQQQAAAEKARADAGQAQAAIADRMIRAPFSGFVSLRTISAGAVVSAGTPLVTVSDISWIKLDFTIPETDLAGLSPGLLVEASAAAFPDTPFIGKISSIDPVIDPSSRAVLVRAILPNPGGRIKPGMLMAVKVRRGERTSVAIPELAVIGNGAARYVYVITPKGTAKQVAVKTGLRDNGLIEVTGIPQGSKVIADGVLKVSDKMKVRLAGAEGGKKGKPVAEAGT